MGWVPTLRVNDMLSSIIRAPGQMLKYLPTYGIILALTGIHGVLYLLNGDIYNAFTQGGGDTLLYSTDTLLLARALLLLFGSLFFSLYSMSIVSRRMNVLSTNKNSLLSSCAAFAIVFIAMLLGLFVVLRAVNELSISGGILTLMATVFNAIAGLIIALSILKFSFAPTYLGMGLLPKDALAQSWNATRGKLVHVLVLLFLMLLITTIIQGAGELITQNIEDETILTIILFVFSSIGLFYSGTVLALAAPEPLAPNITRHARRKK
ncbi:MAG: hypothetical protein FJY86_00055 [Candidatus Diapherotrites archaeon]|uniref:Uncharacterized protein n=1 Tax=Candidatus Iainarchaeum sp. TaxID=3101447 RepID=A0A8T4C5D9_9ARCH|nr:hypothetical protein [Candidatus Diapherotrites archaeon]